MLIRPRVTCLRWVILAAVCGAFGPPGSSGLTGPLSDGRVPLPVIKNVGSRTFDDFGRLPLQFIPNQGQTDKAVGYYIQGRDKTIDFTADGLTFVFAKPVEAGPGRSPVSRWAVKLDFVEAARGCAPVGLEESGTTVSFFRGRPSDWKTGLAACSKIAYRNLWPGIDLVYQGTFDRLKYEFVVHPGADPARIRLAVRGAETFGLTADGRLEIRTPLGGFEDDAPVAYQEIGGVRRDVPVSFELEAGRYGFSVGSYDRGLTLVIDPSTLVYCGFIGGGSNDQGKAIALDGEGCAYVTGWTDSLLSFPVTVGPDLTPNGESYPDAFVAKVDPSGASLVYCGFIGGTKSDVGYGIAVDSLGNAYVAGATLSPQASFPVLTGPDLTYNGGDFYGDGFVAKVDASGTSLDYCGYIGGASDDLACAIAVDEAGGAYVIGTTQSTELNFPVAVGPDLSFNWGSDAFVAKVDPSGAALAYCGYIGGNGGDSGEGIAVDAAGCAYVTGSVYPILDDQGQPSFPYFPTAVGPDLTYNGGGDAFVAKVASNGSSLLYCGYIGGSAYDRAHGIAVDSAGCAYVTGDAKSSEATFPVKVGPGLTYHPMNGYAGDGYDAFLAKVDASGSQLVYCGYIGGSEDDFGYGVAVDAAGNAYVTGETDAFQERDVLSTFPVLNWPYRKANGMDAFVTKVLPSGAGLVYSGFIGGGGTDGGRGIAVDSEGCAYIAGTTNSHDLPAVVGPDLNWHISEDVLVAKVPANPIVYGPEITSLSPPSISAYDPDFTLTVFGTGFAEGALVNFNYETIGETEFISGTELRAPVRGYFYRGAAIPVVVYNPGVEVSHEFIFNVNNPVPVLDSVEPAYISGGYDSSIQVHGSNFVNFSIVRFNGEDIGNGVSWIGSGGAVVPYWLLSQSGNASVTVFNPPPEGGTSNSLTIPVTGYTLVASPGSVTVQAGERAIYPIQVSPQLGPFNNQIKFSCGGLPHGCSASFSPDRLTPGSSPGTVTLRLGTLADSGSAAGLLDPVAPLGPLAAGLLLLLPALWPRLFSRGPIACPPRRRWILAGAALSLFLMVSSCSSGGSTGPSGDGTPKGTYQITVQGTSGVMKVSTTIMLVVN
jgi:hypothetical protein